MLHPETLAATRTVNRGAKSFCIIELADSAQRGSWTPGWPTKIGSGLPYFSLITSVTLPVVIILGVKGILQLQDHGVRPQSAPPLSSFNVHLIGQLQQKDKQATSIFCCSQSIIIPVFSS